MAYIAPNTDIQFFPDLGLSMSHDDTFYFATTAAKDGYFDALPKLGAVQSCSYQRERRGWCRVGLPISQIYNAGYMRYRNASFENKWFYAFVLDVEYINNETTEVHFVIDTLMTWQGTYTLGQCMVEREHTLSDNVGEHLIDEGLSVGDYVVNNVETITPYVPVLVVSAAVKQDPDAATAVINADGTAYNGYMISGLQYRAYTMDSQGINNAIAFVKLVTDNNKQDAIVCMRVVPAYCIPVEDVSKTGNPLTVVNGGTFASGYSVTQLDGYTPANNKMFSYPYIKYEVINGEGSAVLYRLEMFANALQPTFIYRGICFDNCEVMLIPQGYRDAGLNLLYDEAVVMRNFPQASYNIDQYRAYVAQMTSGGGWLDVAGDLVTDIAQAASGNAGGALLSLVGQALNLAQDNIKYSEMPPAVRGTSNANIMSSMGVKSFIGYHKSITSERARSIDRFFTMYGYRVNVVKTPSCNNRPQWTYVKTQGCIVHGNLPAADAQEIENIFNNGVRFWVNPANIGNFTLNNSPGGA